MTVFVDEFPYKGWGKWNGGAHMTGTDIDELHEMAKKIGLRRSWFQDSTFPHYDLTNSKRKLAIAEGCTEIEAGNLPDDVLMRRKDGTYESRRDRMARREREAQT